MDSPLPLRFKLSLRAGTVYYFTHRGFMSPAPHFFIVVNREPQTNKVLLLTAASSQIENVTKRRKNQPPETLVHVAPEEYAAFSKPTVIDCNAVISYSLQELVDKSNRKEVKDHADIPPQILQKILHGIRQSPLVDGAIKKLVSP
ncbi:MAG: hypothetical protein LBK76_05840 [Verrucomicrobiales bacterium]|jgi:hypothetical protein|nr:hypothetical protein [Verrucomicrobiales bacterium]